MFAGLERELKPGVNDSAARLALHRVVPVLFTHINVDGAVAGRGISRPPGQGQVECREGGAPEINEGRAVGVGRDLYRRERMIAHRRPVLEGPHRFARLIGNLHPPAFARPRPHPVQLADIEALRLAVGGRPAFLVPRPNLPPAGRRGLQGVPRIIHIDGLRRRDLARIPQVAFVPGQIFRTGTDENLVGRLDFVLAARVHDPAKIGFGVGDQAFFGMRQQVAEQARRSILGRPRQAKGADSQHHSDQDGFAHGRDMIIRPRLMAMNFLPTRIAVEAGGLMIGPPAFP